MSEKVGKESQYSFAPLHPPRRGVGGGGGGGGVSLSFIITGLYRQTFI